MDWTWNAGWSRPSLLQCGPHPRAPQSPTSRLLYTPFIHHLAEVTRLLHHQPSLRIQVPRREARTLDQAS